MRQPAGPGRCAGRRLPRRFAAGQIEIEIDRRRVAAARRGLSDLRSALVRQRQARSERPARSGRSPAPACGRRASVGPSAAAHRTAARAFALARPRSRAKSIRSDRRPARTGRPVSFAFASTSCSNFGRHRPIELDANLARPGRPHGDGLRMLRIGVADLEQLALAGRAAAPIGPAAVAGDDQAAVGADAGVDRQHVQAREQVGARDVAGGRLERASCDTVCRASSR